ncbi:MAG: sugar isomerase domain-containing protein [Firmicutes bacterium]|nr:sugar isomerase domain-containing protein [Bacillota bacterium]
MMARKYFEVIYQLLRTLEDSQQESISRAADLIADSMAHGGVVHIHDTGHILTHEAVGRAGGPLFVAPLSFGVNVANPVTHPRGKKPRKTSIENRLLLVRHVLDLSNVEPGDVLIIGSVSGTTCEVVELAIEGRKRGVKCIAFTTLSYATAPGVQSEHPSGLYLYQVCDVCINHPGEIGDAALEVPGLDAKVCPTSGITAVCAFWAVIGEAMLKLTERGVVPSVLRKVHIEGAEDFNAKMKERYELLGY